MKERLFGGFLVGILTAIMLFPGGVVSAAVICVIALMGLREVYKVFQLDKTIVAWIGYVATVCVYGLIYFQMSQFLFPSVMIVLLLILAVYVFTFPKYKETDIARTFFGFVYVAIMLSFLLQIRLEESGLLLSIFVLISSWGNDVFAYLVGVSIGKHKFTPRLSPKKSIEGFIGGIAGAGVLGYGYALIFSNVMPFEPIYCAIIAAVGAIPAVIGDLVASAIKRNNDIKDYAKLIPGHGGIMDRFDSVIFTAPIIYYLVVLFNII